MVELLYVLCKDFEFYIRKIYVILEIILDLYIHFMFAYYYFYFNLLPYCYGTIEWQHAGKSFTIFFILLCTDVLKLPINFVIFAYKSVIF